MRLATRMKLTYGTVFIVPLILMFVTFWGMGQIEMRALRQKFDMEEASVEMLVNPYKMLDKISSSIVDELRNTAENSPEKLMDTAYLEQMNQRLEAYSSFLVLRRGGEVYYSGGPGDTGLELSNLELFTVDSGFVSGEEPYHLKQIDFGFSDGSEGVVQILTPVESVVHQVENMIVKAFVLALIILVAVSGTAFFGLYQSIVQPLEKLKRAAVNIKEGNLDFNVITDTEDEIGEVCTAFEEMRIKLKAQIDLSMQYEKDNKELISNISHDLKTPITAVKGYAEGLMDGVADTPEKRDKYIRTIYNKANEMDTLINELTLYAKIDTNRIPYNFAKINVGEYFNDCIEEIGLDLESKNIGLAYFNYTDGSTQIIADPEQLRRVIHNIIGNSIKYLDKQRGLINIRIKDVGDFIQVEIEDNGRGIAAADLPYIFDRFYRADASRNSATGGSGIGLSIVKKIIEDHGGKIWATSKESIGTVMYFVIRKYQEVPNEQSINS